MLLDKTGTITRGKPALTDVFVAPDSRVHRGESCCGWPPSRRASLSTRWREAIVLGAAEHGIQLSAGNYGIATVV